uniref:Odorant receptor 1 n=1 Tax=Lysiphlebia japonica TaxID=104022 RepID=A0A291L1S2_9HYME|nr:odorant receptor 1 [Lysiphlebia japonica]
MMIQTCAQFELLNSRFEKLPRTIKTSKNKSNLNDNLERQVKQNETEKIGNCVEHHIQIIEFSKKNNKIFGTSIFLQYSVSSLVLCMSVLRLSQLRSLSPDLASVFLYLISMISQVFIPCFAGHQLTVESCQVSDAIYSMDWTTLTTSTQKSLVLIMNRSQKPVRFISGYVIPLSMTSFNNVIRISYSIFNVLHSSSAV